MSTPRVVGLAVAGLLAFLLFKAAVKGAFVLLVAALVVGGGAYLYFRAKRALRPGTRARRRLDAAAETYRMRNR